MSCVYVCGRNESPCFSLGMTMGQGGRMRSLSPPHMVLSCLILAPPRMMRKTFSPHPRPSGSREVPPHPVKLYFLLICSTTSTTSTIFLMKPTSLIKIYLKLQLNFQKKLNNISKCLIRQSPKKKKKISHDITHNKIKAKNHIGQNKIS